MKLLNIIVSVAMTATSLTVGPSAVAQDGPTMNLEEQDAYFERCKTEFVNRNMGNDDQAAAFCYERAYGNEQTGGGYPAVETYEGRHCRLTSECNPYVRPE